MRNIIYILFLLFAVVSCNVCDTGNSDNSYKPKDIYFSAKTINSMYSSTFGISSDGGIISELISNSIIFSAPSLLNSLPYTTNLSNSKDILNVINLEKNTDLKILENNAASNGIKSVISKNGKFFTFIINDSLFLYSVDNAKYNFVCENIADNTLPAFSYDSKYLAYIVNLSDNYFVNIVDPQNPNLILSDLEFENNAPNPQITYYPVWMYDSKRVCIIDSKTQNVKTLYIKNIESSQIFSYNISDIGCLSFAAAVNSDKFVICAADGNLYYTELSSSSSKKEKITSVKIDEACLYPRFSNDGSKILFSRALVKNLNQFNSSLYVVNIKDKELTYLFSNVYMGFWY